VYLEGEAYFEVAYNKRKPFIVKVNDANVKVTGTHFNIVSYPTESLSKATLLEGHISVNSGGKDELVAPNYSAIFSKGSKPRIVKEANIDKIMAWKNRQFFWKQDSLTTALREIARWYNVTVKYEGAPPTTIIDYVVDSRSKPLNELMELITTSDRGDTTAYFELKDSTLIVSTNRLH
jgi:ferric-dicitrate binding protein FerR (iron transport regulator)